MSRIAKNSIKIPNETSCKLENDKLFAKGKLGENPAISIKSRPQESHCEQLALRIVEMIWN